ncbi:MAG: LysR family transcriptional regulator [Candidatus Nanopelagicales bacterium]
MAAWDLRRLGMLRELQERGTLAAVAEALGYTPSAVSQQLAVLEREAGTPLLAKAGRGVRLTDAGRLLADHAGVLLAAADAARADLDALHDDVRGVVRAGGLQSATRALLIPALAAAGAAHPELRVEITEMELEQALPELRVGGLDVAVSDEYDGHPRPRPRGLVVETVHEEPLRLVLPASHPQARRRRAVHLESLRDDMWVSSASGTGHHALVLSTCRSLGGYEPDLRHRSNDADVQLELVRSTGAVALLPPLTLPVGDPALAVRDIADGEVSRRLSLVTREGPQPPALRAYLDAVRDAARRLPGRR